MRIKASSIAYVFFSRCFAASYVALLLVLFQYSLDILIQSAIRFLQRLRDVFVNRAFADPEFLRNGAYGEVMLDQIGTKEYASFFRG